MVWVSRPWEVGEGWACIYTQDLLFKEHKTGKLRITYLIQYFNVFTESPIGLCSIYTVFLKSNVFLNCCNSIDIPCTHNTVVFPQYR